MNSIKISKDVVIVSHISIVGPIVRSENVNYMFDVFVSGRNTPYKISSNDLEEINRKRSDLLGICNIDESQLKEF